MRKIIDYRIVYEIDPHDLEIRVKNEIKEGWQPIGGVAANKNNSALLLQVLVKYEEK